MRKHARNWLMKVLLGIIIVVFIFYFGSIGGKQQAETVATVNGKTIAYVDVAKEYQNLIQFYRQRLGPALNDEALNRLNLKQQALDNLVQQTIILQKAREMRLTVSDEEVRASILAMPAFQRGGFFDEKIYQQTLRSNKVTPEDFERIQKDRMIMSLFLSLIQDSVKVLDQDVYDLYRFQNEKVNLHFVQISPGTFRTKITPTDKDLEAYLSEHGQAFRSPDRVQVKYMFFKGEDFAPGVTVTDADITDYYDRHADQFKTTGGKRQALAEVKMKIAAQIRQSGGMLAAATAAKKAHDTIYQEENFEGYAAKNSLTVNTTGFFSAGTPPGELSRIGDAIQPLFSLNKDEIGRVVSDQRGYYVFKVTDKRPAHTPPLKDIRTQVEKKVIDQEANRLAKQEAEALLDSLKKGKTLSAGAAEKKLKLAETGFFRTSDGTPKIGTSRELSAAIFQLTNQNPLPERVFFVDGQYVVLQLKERTKPDGGDLAANQENLRNSLLQVRKNNAIQSWLEGTKAAMIREGKLKIKKDVKDI
ncbi:MAG: SurA N-terminal domain-containing protein [Pseudomonadota bacterium]